MLPRVGERPLSLHEQYTFRISLRADARCDMLKVFESYHAREAVHVLAEQN